MSTDWDQYGDYLQLNKILTAQDLKSMNQGQPVHDEMLFIQFHQINELWFKQILFELDAVQVLLSQKHLRECDMQPLQLYLGRIVEIFKQLESMIDVLETMPPQSFTDVRQYLGTASGFQSVQFRQIEVRLGLLRKQRLCVFHQQFDAHLKSDSQTLIQKSEMQPSLFDMLDSWLARTPFVQVGDYSFWDEYYRAVLSMFDQKIESTRELLKAEAQHLQLQILEKGRSKFEEIFDRQKHELAQAQGRWRLSWQALQAALFIVVYRNEPALQAPYQVLTRIMDVDELLARWRFRHAMMVQRMVGFDKGTGGSSGFEYLMSTVSSHRIFSDLFALSGYLISSSSLPVLPKELRQDMDFRFSPSREG